MTTNTSHLMQSVSLKNRHRQMVEKDVFRNYARKILLASTDDRKLSVVDNIKRPNGDHQSKSIDLSGANKNKEKMGRNEHNMIFKTSDNKPPLQIDITDG